MTPSRLTRRATLAGLAALAAARPALAHRLARTETEVRFRDDGTVAVIHSYHLQDAQDALYEAGLIDTPDLGSLRNRAKLALYTAERFDIYVNELPVALELVGAEIEGGTVYVYQEGAEAWPGELWVEASMLRELIAKQSNSVNVHMGGRVETVDFKGDDIRKAVVVKGRAVDAE